MQSFINMTQHRTDALIQSNGPLNVHDHLKGLSVEELQDISRTDRLPWHTLCLNVTGDLNVGTMIRTSHCMGAKSVIVFGRQKIDNRSLVGAANYITVEKIPGVDNEFNLIATDLANELRCRNLLPIFVEAGGTPFNEIDWKTKLTVATEHNYEICLVMGNETNGIPADILALQSEFVESEVISIPQKGVIRSLNVAVAHAMIVSHLCNEVEWL